jgi:hypothetical protein
VNQYSQFGLDLEKLFFAPGPKIVLQHYRPKSGQTAANFAVTHNPALAVVMQLEKQCHACESPCYCFEIAERIVEHFVE